MVTNSAIKPKRLMEVVMDGAESFLKKEGSIALKGHFIRLTEMQKVELSNLTSIITVGAGMEGINMIFAFTYEKNLINKLFQNYCAGMKIEEAEIPVYLGETAGDMINIVIGNALNNFGDFQLTIPISVPLIINEAKSISKYKETQIYSSEISTDDGKMSIFSFVPREGYIKHFMTGDGNKNEKA